MFKRISWVFFGNITYSGMQFLLMVAISRFFGIEEIGVFGLGLALSAPIVIFMSIGQRPLWITDYLKELNYATFFHCRLFFMVISFFLLLVFSLMYMKSLEHKIVLLVISFSKVVEGLCDIIYAFRHKANRQKEIALSMALRSLIGLLFFIVTAFLTNDFMTSSLMYALGWLFAFIFCDYLPMSKGKNLSISKEYFSLNSFRKIAYAGIPLSVGLLLISINFNMPRFLIESKLGFYELGIFSVIYYFIQIGSVFVNSVGQSFLPQLSALAEKGRYSEHVKASLIVFLITAGFSFSSAFLAYIMGHFILEIIYGHEVSSHSDMLTLLLVFSFPHYAVSFYGHVFSSLKENKKVMYVQVFMLPLVFIFNLKFIYYYGFQGVVYAYALTGFASFALYSILYRRSVLHHLS